MTIQAIGSDIEFVFTRGGIPVSAIGKIGGSKLHPLLVENGNLQEDNVLPEIAVDPAYSPEEFAHNINHVRQQLDYIGNQFGLIHEIRSSVHFPEIELDHPLAKEFGCDPDINAYTGVINEVNAADAGNLRTCGGHVHVSYSEKDDWDTSRQELIQWMDVFLGLPSVLIDKDKERRTLYGKAGAYRHKEYGVEYRSLSNFWVQSDEMIKWVYEQAHRAHSALIDGALNSEYYYRVMKAINTSDPVLATSLMREFGVELPEGFKCH